ncbi:MFS general substrate transporter [Wilcoxina mikolae CBS 423.85]|nr:MFS general substrate transporter [Wilcoxina mikolae CBS 423.85]
MILLGLSLAVFLVALDNAILSTAIPTITADFNSIGDVGWYGSVYLLATCSFQPLTGKIYSQYSMKYTFLSFLFTFELGSLICATAPNSKALIVGRAIAGLGSSGLFSGATNIMAVTMSLQSRAAFMGGISSMFGVATVIGPLIGGVLTQHASWRWCFYINLPCGFVTAVLLIFVFHPKLRKLAALTTIDKLQKLDILGCLFFVPPCIMLLLGIQWGGNNYPWKSGQVLGLIIGCIPLFCIFIAWEHHKGSDAMVPLGIIRQLTVATSCLTMFFQMGGALLMTYYLPIWFQVVKDANPTASGVMMLPTILAQVLLAIVCGALLTKLGYYNPWVIAGAVLTATGTGLMSTFTVSSTAGQWIGYQVIAGCGRGMLMQMPLIAVQAVLPVAQIPIGTALVIFCQFFGGTLMVALGQTAFMNILISSLKTYAPGVDSQKIINAGATADVRNLVSHADIDGVLKAYNRALTGTFYVALGVSCLAFVSGLGLEWKSVKAKKAPVASEP